MKIDYWKLWSTLKERSQLLRKNEYFYIYSIYILSLITVVLTPYAQKFSDYKVENQLQFLNHVVNEDRYTDKYNIALLLRPLTESGILVADKPEELPRASYFAYIQFLGTTSEQEVILDEVNSVNNWSDYFDKLDPGEIEESFQKRAVYSQQIVYNSKKEKFLFSILYIAQVFNIIFAVKLAILTAKIKKRDNKKDDRTNQ